MQGQTARLPVARAGGATPPARRPPRTHTRAPPRLQRVAAPLVPPGVPPGFSTLSAALRRTKPALFFINIELRAFVDPQWKLGWLL